MKLLLDENFPLRLARVLRDAGVEVEHVITLGWRGASDAQIRQRLTDSELVFLTQDDDFLRGPEQLADIARDNRLFELADDGALVPWSAVSRDR